MNQEAQPLAAKAHLPSVGNLLTDAKALVVTRLNFFLTLTLLPAILFVAIAFLGGAEPKPSPLVALLGIVSWVLYLIVNITIIKGMANPTLTNWSEALKAGAPRFFSFIWAGVLMALISFLGFMLLVIPGIYWVILYSLYPYALLIEDKRGWSALKRSRELVKGYWWAVLGRLLAFSLVIWTIMLVVSFVGGLLNNFIAAQTLVYVVSALVMPFGIAYSYLIYKSLGKIKG